MPTAESICAPCLHGDHPSCPGDCRCCGRIVAAIEARKVSGDSPAAGSAARSTGYPFRGYDDNDSPAWVDIGTVRYEHREGFYNGFGAGMLAAFVIVAVVTIVAMVTHG